MSMFLPFDDALSVSRSLVLASSKEWKGWCKAGTRPPEMPADPSVAYRNGWWQGWGHWLGTGTARKTTQWLPFGEALAVAQTLGPAGMSGKREWNEWCKAGMRPAGVPSNPQSFYKDHGWQGWGQGSAPATSAPRSFYRSTRHWSWRGPSTWTAG